MPDFGIRESHIGHVRCRAADDQADAIRVADKCQVGGRRMRAALSAARCVETQRIVEKPGAQGSKLLGHDARRHVPRRAGRAARTGGDAKPRIAGIADETMAWGDVPQTGANGKVSRDGEERTTRCEAEFTDVRGFGFAAETGETRSLDLAERQPYPERGTSISKLENADRQSTLEAALGAKDDNVGPGVRFRYFRRAGR